MKLLPEHNHSLSYRYRAGLWHRGGGAIPIPCQWVDYDMCLHDMGWNEFGFGVFGKFLDEMIYGSWEDE